MEATFWSLVPPLVAIVLALITKEVYFSLLIGILSGALFFADFHVMNALETTFTIMSDKIGGNSNIIIFLVLLGMLVALMNKSGATRAYGEWASKSIKTKRGAGLATMGLGSLIFVDDYFNCLTVGTVMKPVTDRHNISRAKLAYIIDATAAPICIIAPISSWAAAVGSSLPEGSEIDGFNLFLRTIPFNLYALLTIAMVLFLLITNFDFSRMKKYNETHKNESGALETETGVMEKKGHVIDIILPIAVLITLCILGMLYTGGILEGKGIIDAFADCDSSLSLVYGSFFTLIFVFLLYIPRKVVTFTEFANSFVQGFKAMVPAILILTFAWTLSGVCSEDYLNAGGYVSQMVSSHQTVLTMIPALFFLVALGLAFATGTSWGTFGILIPISVAIFGAGDINALTLTVSAVLAGAVCGDHISPISDTTILSSTGAGCNHVEHVSTQIPYALLVAACCLVGYIVAGLTQNGWFGVLVGFAALAILLGSVYAVEKKKAK